ncbi:MAG: threonine synthase [Kiritimatiellae bacterium]|nr:threonine synthase [Kiritimatiellia bacterium]
MKFVSTRKGIEATAHETILRGLAPDGGLFVPETGADCKVRDWSECATLGGALGVALRTFFGDVSEECRAATVQNVLAKFPAEDPIPLVDADGFKILELFHGPTGAFKDVALSALPVLMGEAARKGGAKKVLVLTATSGDTGSAAMAGFGGVDGVQVAVFFPETGTSRLQRLQMTTPADKNVHAIAIKGNFDDAQAAVKRIFADEKFRGEAAKAGINLSSANSINTGRLVPQIAYYLYTAARLGGRRFDVVVPSGNFGNILAAWYAKKMGANIGKFVCASNVNDVLARFIETGTYDPGAKLTVTNSPSMDILKSSNVERLLWLLNYGDGGEVARLMADLANSGKYTLKPEAFARLREEFESASATPEETEEEMRDVYERTGYVLDPHTAVAVRAARKRGYPKADACVVAATATPYKFPETCMRAYCKNLLTNPPAAFAALETAPSRKTKWWKWRASTTR